MIILYGIAILPVLLVYIYYLSRSVLLGWISLLVVYLYDYSLGATTYSPAGINLTLVDVVEISLLIAGIIRTIPRLRDRNSGTNDRSFLSCNLCIQPGAREYRSWICPCCSRIASLCPIPHCVYLLPDRAS